MKIKGTIFCFIKDFNFVCLLAFVPFNSTTLFIIPTFGFEHFLMILPVFFPLRTEMS